MYATPLGYRISAVLFIAGMAGALWLRAQMQITAPTSFSLDPKNSAELQLPVGAEGVISQDQPGDAGDSYRLAIQSFNDDPDAIDAFAEKPDGPLPAAFQRIVDSSRCAQMSLFIRDPSAEIGYESGHPQLDALLKIGQDMNRAALYLAKESNNSAAAKTLYGGVFALGLNLARERVDYDEFSRGAGLMDSALTGLSELLPSGSPEAQALQAKADAMAGYDQLSVEPIYATLSSADPSKIAANAGDVFRFATLAPERMFRVEAILKLGRYRFDAARAADQLAAPRFLRDLQHDPDPLVRAAAQAAQGLTLEQYRMIH